MKTYKKQNDKYGIYFKCLLCKVTSQDEIYIKSKSCCQPIIKTTGVIAEVNQKQSFEEMRDSGAQILIQKHKKRC